MQNRMYMRMYRRMRIEDGRMFPGRVRLLVNEELHLRPGLEPAFSLQGAAASPCLQCLQGIHSNAYKYNAYNAYNAYKACNAYNAYKAMPTHFPPDQSHPKCACLLGL